MGKFINTFKFVLVLTILVLVNPAVSLASGVPVYQYDAGINYSQNNVYVSGTSYDWMTSQYDASGYIYYRYYKVLWTSPSYTGTDLYITRVNYNGSAANSGYSNWLQVEGSNDGVNWFYISNLNYGSNISATLPPVKRIRIVAGVGYYNSICYANFSITVNTISLSLLGADQSTVQAAVDAANSAKTEAINAKNAANNAKSSADAAKTSADTAAARSYYNGNTSAYWGYNAYAKADSAASDTNYIKNTQLVNMQNAITNLTNKVTNIENTLTAGDSTPPTILSIKGYNGATCTTGSTFSVTVQAFDNSGVLEFRVMADTGAWSDWLPISSYNTASGITGTGAHTLTVEVRDSAGNVSTGTMTFFKL
jgi:hypothetical protein